MFINYVDLADFVIFPAYKWVELINPVRFVLEFLVVRLTVMQYLGTDFFISILNLFLSLAIGWIWTW